MFSLRNLGLATLALASISLSGQAQNPNASPRAFEAVAAAQAKLNAAPHHDDRVIVQFKAGVDAAAQETFHAKAGTKRHGHFRQTPGFDVRERNGNKSLADTIAEYEASGLVEYAEPDYRVQASRVPNDPAYLSGQLWQLNNTGQNGGKSDADMDAPEAWDTRAISSTIVAVIDTGIRYTHEDLKANMWRNPNEIPGNGIDDDGDGYIDDVYGINAITGSGNPRDDDGHGTHVAGTIAAVGNNGKGVTGVAWTARLMACKFLAADGGGYTSDAIDAIDYARSHGAKVMNNSWSGGDYSQALYDAINRARTAGVIFVVAAGNDGANNDKAAVYPANYALDNIISVAATTQTDKLATFSNYGATRVELGAPGENIYSTYNVSDSSYTTLSGTSMAAPQVSGALALLCTQFPSDPMPRLISRLLTAVDPLSSLAGKTSTGGRLNIQRALDPHAANDNFADAAVAVGDSFRVTGTVFGATSEPGEPLHAGKLGGRSVWWQWTPAASGTVKANTSLSGFNTLLAVYTGASVSQLTPIASNDNANSTVTTSAVTFTCVAGRTYYFAVDGAGTAQGRITLTVRGPASGEINNAFANRSKLAGSSFRVTGENASANKEALELNHAGNAGGKSVWWTWTAPSSGYFTLDTLDSSFDTLLAVYTGTALGGLKVVASNDEADSTTHASRVRFYAAAGQAYQIAVDGYEGASGQITLAGRYR